MKLRSDDFYKLFKKNNFAYEKKNKVLKNVKYTATRNMFPMTLNFQS